MLDDKTLKFYSRQGLIPGPEENEEDFLRRARYCLDIGAFLEKESPLPLAGASDEDQARQVLEEAHRISLPLYGIAPEWTPLYFSNYKLAPWHGGCAWIFQLNEGSPVSALFQLRKSFKENKKCFGYSREEIVAHELGHVGRMLFNEPKFEEMLCYQSSGSRFRRWFGPIIQSSRESALFAFLLIMIIMGDLFVILFGNEALFSAMMWLKLVPAAMVLYGLMRLRTRHRQFDACLFKLEQILSDKSKARAAAYRLTDGEIIFFAGAELEKIVEYAEKSSRNSLRWRQITLSYHFSLPSGI